MSAISTTPATSPLTIQELTMHQEVMNSWSFFGCCFSPRGGTLALAKIFKDKLATLNYRPSLVRTRSIRIIFDRTESFLDKISTRKYLGISRSRRKTIADLRVSLVVTKLQLISLQRPSEEGPAAPMLEIGRLTGNQVNALTLFINKTCLNVLGSSRTYPMTSEKARHLETVFRDLPVGNQDREAMLSAIQGYRRSLRLSDKDAYTVERFDPVKERAQGLREHVLRDFPDLVPFILANTTLQRLFQEQVVRDGLSLEIFFRHPMEAEFLRRSENLSNSVSMADHQITIGQDDLPEILFDGRRIPIRDLPGYHDGSFKNLHGWDTLGCSTEDMSLSKASITAITEDHVGFVYTKSRGLIPFNPRTWAHNVDGRGWESIDLEAPSWWKALPAYKIRDIELDPECPTDSGWRLEWLSSYEQEAPQFAGTHSFLCLIIPLERPTPEGKVKVGYYPFGLFAHFYGGTRTILKRMKKELHYLDQNLHEGGRAFSAYQRIITEEQGLACLDQLKIERLESLDEADDLKEPSFYFPRENCTQLLSRIAHIVGERLPADLPRKHMLSGRCWKIFSALGAVTAIKSRVFKLLGANQVDSQWDGVAASPYTLKNYLDLRRTSEVLCGDPASLNRIRPFLLTNCRWEKISDIA